MNTLTVSSTRPIDVFNNYSRWERAQRENAAGDDRSAERYVSACAELHMGRSLALSGSVLA